MQPALPVACTQWRSATGLKVPTIVPVAALCLLGICEVGFPSSVMIKPAMPWIIALANKIKVATEGYVRESRRLTSLFKTDDLMFVRSRDSFWFSFNYVGVSDRTFELGWIFRETRHVYNKLPPAQQDEIIERQDGEYTGDVYAVLISECSALVQRFNPRDWADKIEKIVSLQNITFRPQNLLWTQILLIDIAIHFFVRGGFYEGHTEGYDLWTKEVVAVLSATVHSWDPSVEAMKTDEKENGTNVKDETSGETEAKAMDPGSSKDAKAPLVSILPSVPENEAHCENIEWDLAGSLRKQVDLFTSDEGEKREQKIKKLAGLLQLRVLFVLALLMLIPDSSDVYLAEKYKVEMPMI